MQLGVRKLLEGIRVACRISEPARTIDEVLLLGLLQVVSVVVHVVVRHSIQGCHTNRKDQLVLYILANILINYYKSDTGFI